VDDLPDKVRVDLAEVTFGEMIDATEAANVADPTAASAADQARLNAAFCWVVIRRRFQSTGIGSGASGSANVRRAPAR